MYARIFLDPKFRFDKPKTLYFQRNHVSLKHPCTKAAAPISPDIQHTHNVSLPCDSELQNNGYKADVHHGPHPHSS